MAGINGKLRRLEPCVGLRRAPVGAVEGVRECRRSTHAKALWVQAFVEAFDGGNSRDGADKRVAPQGLLRAAGLTTDSYLKRGYLSQKAATLFHCEMRAIEPSEFTDKCAEHLDRIVDQLLPRIVALQGTH